MLFLISTPIGNLADITLRALDVMKECDYILCEDTRHTKRLVDHYGIITPLRSYHKFNEKCSIEPILSDLQEGKKIALVSDAGTPGISDPGTVLVEACVEANVQVIPLPGPCAAIAALSASGLDTERFQFLGFLPKKRGELQLLLAEVFQYPGTTVCYESPHRICDLLTVIAELAPKRPLVVSREITKKFEESLRGTASDIISKMKSQVKGEFVVMISGRQEDGESWLELSIEEHVMQLQKAFSISLSEAIKIAAQQRGVPKNQIYKQFHSK